MGKGGMYGYLRKVCGRRRPIGAREANLDSALSAR